MKTEYKPTLPYSIRHGFMELYPQLSLNDYYAIEDSFFQYMKLHKGNNDSFAMVSQQVDCLWHYLIVTLSERELDLLWLTHAGRRVGHKENSKLSRSEIKLSEINMATSSKTYDSKPDVPFMLPIIIDQSTPDNIVLDTNKSDKSDTSDYITSTRHKEFYCCSGSTTKSTNFSSCSSSSSCSSASSCSSSSCSSS